MKRKDLVKHLRRHGCELLREGSSHSIWVNPANQQQASIPRRFAGNWELRNLRKPQIDMR